MARTMFYLPYREIVFSLHKNYYMKRIIMLYLYKMISWIQKIKRFAILCKLKLIKLSIVQSRFHFSNLNHCILINTLYTPQKFL